MQSDGDGVTRRRPHGSAYDAEDLAYLQTLLGELSADLRRRDGVLIGTGTKQDLENRIAIALFDCAEPGERNGPELKRTARERVFSSGTVGHQAR